MQGRQHQTSKQAFSYARLDDEYVAFLSCFRIPPAWLVSEASLAFASNQALLLHSSGFGC
jgi:hypothetical protein